ncbi:hypothetical protein V2J09_001917 [Rumex salicifolius]
MSFGGMLRKIMPISQSKSSSEYDEMNVEYSIALEYNGPPVEHYIPHAAPLDFDQIPTAKVATPAAGLADLAWPVVQPISKSSKKQKRDSDIRIRIRSSSFKEGAVDRGESLVLSKQLHVNGAKEGSGEMISSSSSRVSDELIGRAVDGTESSGTLGFSDSRGHSHELSGSSDIEDVKGSRKYIDTGNWNSTETSLTPQAFSVEVSSSCEEVSDDEGLQRIARRGSITFVEPDSGEMMDEENDEEDENGDSVSDVQQAVRLRRQLPERVVRKGLCFRCLKGNRLTEKEVCIACEAKYCCNCVLRAMGSMPEGRKCLTCLGFPINESKRRYLGRCSRMLRRLLNKDEIKLIMHYEVSCAVNQIPAELITVNGDPLSEEELNLLLNCSVPPRKLKPGRYWYDKVSGFWGKEGHKPCQIISHDLNVGDRIKPNASNGSTDLLINGRKITKAELWMLKFVGVHCAGISSLWLEADGSYTEEGMRNVKGCIWGKKRTKVLCTLLSLPIPDSSRSNGILPNHSGEGSPLHKLLLLGNNQSGTSTIFKQARAAYNVLLSDEEKENMKCLIQSKMYGYLAVLLEGRELFEEECLAEMRAQAAEQPGPSDYINKEIDKTVYSIGSKLRSFSDWLVNITVSGNLDTMFPAATREYAPYVEELWKDPAIQATYSRVYELGLPRVANYILNKAAEIAKVDYEPSETDILCTEGINSSNGLAQMEFSFPRSAEENGSTDHDDQSNSITRCQLIRVHKNNLGKQCKWLEMFEDVSIVLFCVSLSDYDEFKVNNEGVLVNKMMASKNLFESLVSHSTFSNTIFLLILNKFDLLEEKIEQAPLTQCEWFSDFKPVLSRNQNNRTTANNTPPLAQRAFHYVAVKFKRLFKSMTDRNLYVYRTTALEQHTVDGAMNYAREILKWEEEKISLSLSYSLNEVSSESIDASTY